MTPGGKDVLTIVLAGGEGKRLAPLTADRAKPAVPFGGHYRIIDFVLSNLANAGYLQIVVLTQYKSHSLNQHISRDVAACRPCSATTSSPCRRRCARGPRWFTGSADAIYQNLNLIADEQPDYICVFGADHVYRMDPRQMVEQHIDSGAAACTVAAHPRADRARPATFGVIEPAADGRTHRTLPGEAEGRRGPARRPDEVFASMGNYVFTTETLVDAVTRRRRGRGLARTTSAATSSRMLVERRRGPRLRLRRTTGCPGQTERDRGYWRDVGTLDAYYESHMDLVAVDPDLQPLQPASGRSTPRRRPLPPAKFVFDDEDRRGVAVDSMVCAGVHHLRRHRAALGDLAGRARRTPTPPSRTPCCMHDVVSGARPSSARHHRQERRGAAAARRSASTPRHDARRFTVIAHGTWSWDPKGDAVTA